MWPWLGALIGALVEVAGTLVGRVLLSLGIGYSVFTGVDTGLSWLHSQALAGFSGMPAQVVQIASVTQVGTSINIIFSALTARLVLQGLTGGAIRRMIVKG